MSEGVRCKTCGGDSAGYKCDVCGAEAAEHDGQHGAGMSDHPMGAAHCMVKCAACNEAETKCSCQKT